MGGSGGFQGAFEVLAVGVKVVGGIVKEVFQGDVAAEGGVLGSRSWVYSLRASWAPTLWLPDDGLSVSRTTSRRSVSSVTLHASAIL